MTIRSLVVLGLLTLPGLAIAADDPPIRPLTPAESLEAFRVKPGLKVELVASEPLVESPVTVDFGADGRLWVCEMRDYPSGIDGKGKPGGAVKVLEDRDRDGRYETATTFLDGLSFPTGAMEWRKGVLICAAPEIIYAEDTDSDGKADVRRVLFQGFSTENFQARVNGLAYGLDNWVYGANGLIGGTIRGMASNKRIDIGGRDFRMKPDTGEFEPASGLTQQGRVRDDWGNQFGGNNSVLIQHYPLPEEASRRNPSYAPPSPAVSLARGDDPSRLFPASRTLTRFNKPESANQVTSACSPLIYRDSLLGPDYAGNAFVCEPVHNLVRRLVLKPDGITFTGHRTEDERASEFLASVDPWCRPVQVRTGPDGALWIVDFYRFVIEHPRWISPELLATLDVRAGADKGRIYRVIPIGTPIRPVARLDGLSTPNLAASLNSPNGTVRDLVHRLLVHRADRAASPILVDLVRTSPHPECRAQALGVLDGLSELRPPILVQALADPHPGVRREAVRLSGHWLGQDEILGRSILSMTDDPAITVRFQLAMTLGDWPDPLAGQALGKIAIRDQADRWVLAAVLTSAVPHAGTLLEQFFASAGPEGLSSKLAEPLIATIGGSSDDLMIARALATIGGINGSKPEPWRLATMAGLLDASRRRDLATDPTVLRSIASARLLAADSMARPADRVSALRLLGRDRHNLDSDREAIATRLAPSEPSEVQLGAIQALSRLGDRQSAEAVVSRWTKLGPSTRSAAIDAFLGREGPTVVLLGALEDGRIETAQIDAAHRARMLEKGSEALRHRASVIFGTLEARPRQVVLDTYAAARTHRGDSERGKKVFERVCAACHKVAGIGTEVGPDLVALTDKSPEALLIAILDPNREVDARYAGYSASLKDGRVLSGLIAAETASSVILKRQDGQSESILRTDLEELTTSGRSLMPEGLENDIKLPDMADLIAFLAPGNTRSKIMEGNQPRKVLQRADGSIVLEASSAEIYGPSLIFEANFANLGYWHSEQDHAAWNFHVDRPTRFTLSMEWACADGSAGNAYQIQVDDRVIRGKVGGTGNWSNYRVLFLQELNLTAGDHRLEIRPASPIRNALADVHAFLLTPSIQARLGVPIPGGSADELARQILDPGRVSS
jgi:putative membrane-bound dehydrogenase-like protein